MPAPLVVDRTRTLEAPGNQMVLVTAHERETPALARLAVRFGAPLGVLVLGLVAWTVVVSALHVQPYLVPTPWEIARAGFDERSQFLTPILVTMREAYLGFALSAVLGVAVAMVMARWSTLEGGFYPYLLLFQTIPIIAIAPLLVVWIGAGSGTNMTVAAIISFFPVVTNALTGLKATDRNLVDLYRMAGATRRDEMLTLRLPAALPYIFAGLRIAAGAAVIGAIVGEFVAGEGGGNGGLGYTITEDALQLRTPELFVGVVLSCLVALLLFSAVSTAGHLSLRRWHESARRRSD